MISQEDLKKYVIYDPFTGTIRRTFAVKKSRTAGCVIGTVDKRTGYIYTWVNGEKLSAQKLAWVYMFGAILEGYVIDHIDRNPGNNRIDNLRVVTRQVDSTNRSYFNSKKTTKHKGVSYVAKTNKYRATIMRYYQQIHLGTFNTLEEAIKARKEAELII